MTLATGVLHADGLYQKYGTNAGISANGGELRTAADFKEVELTLTLTDVGSGSTIINDQVVIPKNARIQEVEVLCHTAADSASDTATLNLGLIGTNRSSTIDADGLLATYDQSRMDGAGEKNVVILAGTDAGALIGTTLAAAGLVVADYDTEAFTAGVIKIRIRYYIQ